MFANLPITIGTLDYAVRSVRPQVVRTITSAALGVNKIYSLGLAAGLELNLGSAEYGDFIQVDFYSGETPTSLTITAPIGITDVDLTPEANTMYSLFFDYGDRIATSTGNTPGWRFSYAAYPHEEV